MDTPTMKSVFERAKARPLPFIGFIIALIALLYILWWIFNPSHQNTESQSKRTIIVNQKIITPVKQPNSGITTVATDASAVEVTEPSASQTTLTTSSISKISTTSLINTPVENAAALPKDTVSAAEELDRLKDEQSRLKDRKKDLAKQLAISSKLLALKEQQLKELSQINP
jgi:hypothetical protein